MLRDIVNDKYFFFFSLRLLLPFSACDLSDSKFKIQNFNVN